MAKTNIKIPKKIPMDMPMEANHQGIYKRLNEIIDCLGEIVTTLDTLTDKLIEAGVLVKRKGDE